MSNTPNRILQSVANSPGAVNQSAIGNNNSQKAYSPELAQDHENLQKADAIELLRKIEELVRISNLSEPLEEELIANIITAKKTLEKDEPNKEMTAMTLKNAADTLEKASKVADNANNLWQKLQPFFEKVILWLGSSMV